MIGTTTTLNNTGKKGINGSRANVKGSIKGGSFITPKIKHQGHH